jgi:hypothetical protein
MTARDSYLKRKYGITEADYNALLAGQDGVCAICGKKPGQFKLVVDHDHVTGAVRGLLHNRCNKALGPFEWDEAVLLRTANYLNKIIEGRANA